MASFHPGHAAWSWRGCLTFSFFFVIPKESNYKYTTNFPPKKPVFRPNYSQFTSLKMGEGGTRCESQKLRIKAARVTGRARGSRARCGESQATPLSTNRYCSWVTLTPNAMGSQPHCTFPQRHSSCRTGPCSHPALLHSLLSTSSLRLINISLFQHSELHQPVAPYRPCILVTCPDLVLLQMNFVKQIPNVQPWQVCGIIALLALGFV